MISVAQALEIISSKTIDFGIEEIELSQSVNRILKEDWYTDRDMPPYDRVTMDGIAIQFASLEAGLRTFSIEGIAAAGMEQMTLKNDQACLEVMTGSILPNNCDTIIRYEDVVIENGQANMNVHAIKYRQNIHFKGEDRKKGDLVVKKNCKISPAEIGIGASIGKAKVKVARLPKVMVISTGDELVNINATPLAHQIRRSNVYRLITSLKSYNIKADEDHINDDVADLKSKLKKYLEEYDVLLLSGGVSKGKFDFLPEVLNSLGVEKLFHRLKQRPGKPFWFGQYAGKCTVFALPGNPVSSFLCMQRYFRFWLELSQSGAAPKPKYARLNTAINFKPDLTYFHEVALDFSADGQLIANPVKGNGSGDLANMVNADAFVELPRGRNEFKAGEIFPVWEYR